MIDLKGEAFKMWVYFSKNIDGYTFALSKVDAIKWGIGSASSYDRAIAELTRKGYLVNTGSNYYNFYEIPRAKEEMIVTVIK